MRFLAVLILTILLALPGLSVELFRYRAATTDGVTLEYIFEADQQNSPNAITEEKAAEIAADLVRSLSKQRLKQNRSAPLDGITNKTGLSDSQVPRIDRH